LTDNLIIVVLQVRSIVQNYTTDQNIVLDMIQYLNMCSKDDISQINIPIETKNEKWENLKKNKNGHAQKYKW